MLKLCAGFLRKPKKRAVKNERECVPDGNVACLDAAYSREKVVSACVLLAHWDDEKTAAEWTAVSSPTSPYKPGAFYLRELEPLLAVLSRAHVELGLAVVDGYVYLDRQGRPGLGAYLWEALRRKIPVIGVAKNPFGSEPPGLRVYRGRSRRPLYVTAAGIPVQTAARLVERMAGPHRIPAAMKRAHSLARRTLSEVTGP